MSGQKLRRLFVAAGLGLIALALGVEMIPGTEPGIGPMQMLLLATGMALALFAILRLRVRAIVPMLLLCLVLGEGAVRLLGYTPNYTPELMAAALQPLEYSTLYTCSPERGCRVNSESSERESYCDEIEKPVMRWCMANAQGYGDAEDFVAVNAPEDAYRILLLGDSFTWGASALVGNGWGEVLEAKLKAQQPAVVWNAAILGTGTEQALVSAREILPVLRPDLVILGFFENDFMDSLYPLDKLVRVRAQEQWAFVFAYELEPDLTLRRLAERDLYFRTRGRPAPRSEVELLIGQSALGSLLLNAFHSATRTPQAQLDAESFRRTRELLAQLQQSVEEAGSRLVVLNIPARRSIEGDEAAVKALENLRRIAQELGLEVVEVYELLDRSHYQNANPDDEHWNDAGHAIAGQVMSEYVQKLIDDGELRAP